MGHVGGYLECACEALTGNVPALDGLAHAHDHLPAVRAEADIPVAPDADILARGDFKQFAAALGIPDPAALQKAELAARESPPVRRKHQALDGRPRTGGCLQDAGWLGRRGGLAQAPHVVPLPAAEPGRALVQ